jgi:hypothetical protein
MEIRGFFRSFPPGCGKIKSMSGEERPSEDFVSLYRRAFTDYRSRALWNVRELEDPSIEDALVVARYLRLEGNLAARRLAEQIEKTCGAAH